MAISVGAILVGCGDPPLEQHDEAEGELSGLEQALTTTSFTMSAAYYATDRNGNCASSSKRSIVGLEPTDEGTFPVFVYLTGTNMPFNGPEAKLFTQQMAARGFVAAAVDYDSSSYPSCSMMTKKASCIFNAGSANSAVAGPWCARASSPTAPRTIVTTTRTEIAPAPRTTDSMQAGSAAAHRGRSDQASTGSRAKPRDEA